MNFHCKQFDFLKSNYAVLEKGFRYFIINDHLLSSKIIDLLRFQISFEN